MRVPIDEVDVIVLGLGVGGETLAASLLAGGLSVVGIDERLVGGECAYYGCIPTKIMVRGSDLVAEVRRAGVAESDAEVRAEWDRARRRVREATDDFDDAVAVQRFENNGGRFERGRGRITGPDLVEVDGTTFCARRALVIASGTEPAIPDIPGIDTVPYWTNRDAVQADPLPESILVLGGGAVGVEFAQLWRRFGVEVTLVDTSDRLLGHEEPEASALITDVLREKGVDVHSGVTIEGVATDESGAIVVQLGDGGEVRVEKLLCAAGRNANLRALGVGAAGLDEAAKRLDVDERLRAAPGIWAIGDVTGKGEFTHVATYQAKIASDDILGNDHAPARYHAVPRVTFSDPEVGAVGLTEGQAVEQGRRVRCVSSDVARSARGFVYGDGARGLIKLVFDESSEVLIGSTSVGPSGGEVLGMLTLAVHAELTRDVLRQMIYAYPTFHRAVLDALDRW